MKPRHVPLRTVARLLGSLGVFGCFPAESEPPLRAGLPVTEAQYPGAVARAWCDVLGGCCRAASLDFAEEDCLQRVTLERESELYLSQVLWVRFDAVAAQQCIDAFSTVATTCGEPAWEEWEPCLRVYVGRSQLGDACSSHQECEGSEFGTAECSDDTEICVERMERRATLDEPCSWTCNEIECRQQATEGGAGACFVMDGLYCHPTTAVCSSPIPAVGERCYGYCAEGAYCNSAATCVARSATGSCAASEDACVHESTCDETTRMCRPKAADGAACSVRSDCLAGACNDGVCGPFTLASRAACSGNIEPSLD
jgi:hypothetical protein